MDTTTTDEELAALSAAELIPPRAKPRKLTMTDKIVEARDLNLKKAERLKERADRLRQELARCVAELNECRAEVGRGNAALPLEQRRGGELAVSGPVPEQAQQLVNGADATAITGPEVRAVTAALNRRKLPWGSPLDQGRNQRQMRQVRALERAEAREERGPIVQLRELDRRLGEGIGAARERHRLLMTEWPGVLKSKASR